MPAELFTSFADFKTYVGGRANTSIKIESLEATIYETARRHITPWLSQALYDELVTGTGLTAAETALIPYVKRPLAILTMYEYSKVGAIEDLKRIFAFPEKVESIKEQLKLFFKMPHLRPSTIL